MSGKDLRQMELDRYMTIKEAEENWKGYSAIEKLSYVQKSFDQLNAYQSARLGTNPSDVKFAFCTGLHVNGVYNNSSNCIAMPLVGCMFLFGPRAIDQVLRHELRHAEQYTKGFDNRDGKYYSSEEYASYMHGASPIEKDADQASYMGMMKMDLTAMLKSDEKVVAGKQLVEDAKHFFASTRNHFFDTVAYLTHGKVILGRSEADKSQRGSVYSSSNPSSPDCIVPNIPLFYSLGQMERLISGHPERFEFDNFFKKGEDGKSAEDSGHKTFIRYKENTFETHFGGCMYGRFDKETGERHCVSVKDYEIKDGEFKYLPRKEIVVSHNFDRYDEKGNLIDPADKYFDYSCYVPQEVQDALSQKITKVEQNTDEATQGGEQGIEFGVQNTSNEAVASGQEPTLPQAPEIDLEPKVPEIEAVPEMEE